MSSFHVLVTDHGFPNLDPEARVLGGIGAAVAAGQCRTADDVLAAGRQADALLVNAAPVTANVIGRLERCRAIVRYGGDLTNIDVAAARRRGIAVGHVPDHGVEETAEHVVAFALALMRQLPRLDRRLRSGVWQPAPERPMPRLRDCTFGTAGLDGAARRAHELMRAFGCRLVACEPGAGTDDLALLGIEPVSRDELFAQADILSLHLALTPATRHFVNARQLGRMRPHAIVINTAAGGLVDTRALAVALCNGVIAGAGLDAFEQEPLERFHPLLACPAALLSPRLAGYSERSAGELQRRAAEEVARALLGEPLLHPAPERVPALAML